MGKKKVQDVVATVVEPQVEVTTTVEETTPIVDTTVVAVVKNSPGRPVSPDSERQKHLAEMALRAEENGGQCYFSGFEPNPRLPGIVKVPPRVVTTHPTLLENSFGMKYL